MKDVLEKLIDSLNNGNVLLALIIVAVALVFNYKTIVEFFEDRKKAKIVKLTDALKSELISGLTKSHLEEELVTEQFKITTGIRLEKEFREAVIKAHRKTQGELEFIHFKRALPHIFYKDLKLEVKIYWFERFSCGFNFVFGFILAFLGLALMVVPSQIEEVKFIQAINMFGTGGFFIVIALFMLIQTFPIVSAKLVKAELKKAHDEVCNESN